MIKSVGKIRTTVTLISSVFFITQCGRSEQKIESTSEIQQIQGLVPFAPQDIFVLFGAGTSPRSRWTLNDLGFTQEEFKYLALHSQKADSKELPSEVFFSERQQECLRNPQNWEVTALRLDPLSKSSFVLGQPAVWGTLEKELNLSLGRVPQVRLVVRPFCEETDADTEKKTIVPQDFAFHLIYDLLPPALSQNIQNQLLKLVGLQKQGTIEGQKDILASVNRVYESQEYQSFYADFVKNWNAFSQKRLIANSNSPSTYQWMKGKILEAIKLVPHTQDIIAGSQDNSSVAASLEKEFLGELTQKYLLKDANHRIGLTNITSLYTAGSLIWKFNGFSVDNNQKITEKDTLDSFGAQRVGTGIKLFPLVRQNKGSAQSTTVLNPTKLQDMGNLELESRPIEGFEFGMEFQNKMLDFGNVHSSSQSCASCHGIINNRFDGAQYDFHMAAGITQFMSWEAIVQAKDWNKKLGLTTLAEFDKSPQKIKSCVVVESGFSNLRDSNGKLVASVKKGTKLILDPSADTPTRLGVLLTGWVDKSHTSCNTLSDETCTEAARQEKVTVTKISDSLGTSSAKGATYQFYDQPESETGNVLQSGWTLKSPEFNSISSFIHFKVAGSVDKSHCK